jgi:hypothetical protein
MDPSVPPPVLGRRSSLQAGQELADGGGSTKDAAPNSSVWQENNDPVVKSTDMPDVMQHHAIQCTQKAIETAKEEGQWPQRTPTTDQPSSAPNTDRRQQQHHLQRMCTLCTTWTGQSDPASDCGARRCHSSHPIRITTPTSRRAHSFCLFAFCLLRARLGSKKSEFHNILAKCIKKEFDATYGGVWHCVVGRNFGSFVVHQSRTFVYFYLGQTAVLLFKSGSQAL